MAGTLPGVKAARRRRIHHRHQRGGGAGGWMDFSTGGLVSVHGFTRRPVFCLFASSFEPNPVSAMSGVERSGMNRTCQDEMLGKLAREAKERLDERLRAQRTSLMNRNNSDLSEERVTKMARELKTEVFGSNKKKLKLLRWVSRLSGKKSTEEEEEEECAVCLEHYKVGETMVNLPCAHRFHSSCLLPWLQTHALCPCCRMTILP